VVRDAQPSDGEDLGIGRRFRSALASVDDPALASVELLPVRLSRACAKALGADGVGLCVFAADFRIPLGASDDDAAVAERLQFTLGQGPCLDAHAHNRPWRGSAEHIRQQWPVFHDQLVARTSFRSIISVPLHLGPTVGGAMDLYLRQPQQVPTLQLADVYAAAESIAQALSWQQAGTMTDLDDGSGWLYGSAARARTTVWIAIGMLNAHYDLNTPDAFALLRAYAYSHEHLLDDVADRLVHGTLPVDQLAG
jgi:hypothetical protein